MEAIQTAIRFFHDGGVLMYPIVLVLAVGLAIAIERYVYLSASKVANRSAFKKVLPMIRSGDLNAAYSFANKSKSAVGNMLTLALSRFSNSRQRDDLEVAMEESLMEAIPRLEKRTQYVATFANIATLLGLLGTIIGLIQAFTAVANADPTEKASLLSESISVAMNTTAFGLMAAIPLLLLHTVLQTKTTEIIDTLEMTAVKLTNLMTNKKEQ